ncbi:TerB family tellurite resistance protein [Agrobacterium vitis]|uniref:TerB family tellurite resistance protein n=1 Tax=Agrobacterium vitis TaxID=373 RepID=UPI001F1FF2A2|nr:TerB family tellurite resistance protein [Agrobacterium vitis]
MSIFGKLKAAMSGATNKISGRKDFLEAVAAASALMASADGSVSDDEVLTVLAAAKANPNLKAAFSETDIDNAVNIMLDRAKTGRAGRLSLYKEIEDIKADPEMSEIALSIALDVADSDGSFSDDEKAVAKTIAGKLNLDLNKYLSV